MVSQRQFTPKITHYTLLIVIPRRHAQATLAALLHPWYGSLRCKSVLLQVFLVIKLPCFPSEDVSHAPIELVVSLSVLISLVMEATLLTSVAADKFLAGTFVLTEMKALGSHRHRWGAAGDCGCESQSGGGANYWVRAARASG